MNQPDRDRRWRVAALCLFVALAALMLSTVTQYGLTWDEEVQADYGEAVLSWYTSLFADRTALIDLSHLQAGQIVEHFYGAAFDVVAQIATRVSPLGPYETRHVVNVVVALLGIIATYRLGALLGGARSGVVAAALLVLTPAYYGHAFNNPKDVPFAALHAWVLVLALETADRLPAIAWPRVLALGATIGLALGVRVGGAFVFLYVLVAWAATLLVRRDVAGARRVAGPAAARFAVVVGVAWAVLLLSWPSAQVAPVSRPIEALLELRRTGRVVRVLFEGRTLLSTGLPRSYLPVWLANTLPEIWFVAVAASIVAALRALRRPVDAGRALRLGVVALSVAFPVATAILTRPNMFDSWRHFLFIAPPAAALAGHGFASFLSDRSLPRLVRPAAIGVAAVAVAVLVADLVRLHPYQTVYFNRAIAGGLPGAQGRFDTDYWGASHREGLEWLVSAIRPTPGRPVRVSNCATAFLTTYPLSRDPRAAGFVYVAPNEEPDVFLATTRDDCAGRIAADGGRPLHAVERMGVPLLVVITAPWAALPLP